MCCVGRSSSDLLSDEEEYTTSRNIIEGEKMVKLHTGELDHLVERIDALGGLGTASLTKALTPSRRLILPANCASMKRFQAGH